MALYVNILTNKTGQQTTLNLVPVLSGMSVTTAKQAYVFGGPFWLRAGNNEALLATASSSVQSYLNGRVQSGRIATELAQKNPDPAAEGDRVEIPSILLPSPLDYTTLSSNINTASRIPSSSYQYFSVRDLSPASSSETIDLTGLSAYAWYGQISLYGSAPLAIVTDGALNLATFGASTSTVDVVNVSTTRTTRSAAAIPYPYFDMLIGTFSLPKSAHLTLSQQEATHS